MLEPSVFNQLVEIISANFSPQEINEIGRIILKDFDSHKITGTRDHITIGPRKCATALVQTADESKKVDNLIQMIAELDEKTLLGRLVRVEGLEMLLHDLSKIGMAYDFQKRKVLHNKADINQLVNFGSLKDGKEYLLSIMSLDIVENSRLVKKYGTKAMEKVYFQLRVFLQAKLDAYDGRIWSFAGDGGIIAFTFKDQEIRAVLCALDILRGLPIFNMTSSLPKAETLTLRLGLHAGKMRFSSATGSIVSDVINYAAHLEKQVTEAGKLSVSASMMTKMNPRIQAVFKNCGLFEDQDYFQTVNRMDLI